MVPTDEALASLHAVHREQTTPLRLIDVSIRFQRPDHSQIEIVNGLNLDVEAGSMHCLAGRSGSGKTSILAVAACTAEPVSGTVTWNGQQVGGLAPEALAKLRRATMGITDQSGELIKSLTTFENVLVAAIPDGRTAELAARAEELLGRLGLSERRSQRPESLSGGERQRITLARALLLKPKVHVIDEPTASLDRMWADRVIELLVEEVSSGTAILVAAHDPHLIQSATSVTELE